VARRQGGWRLESHADRIIDPPAGPVIDCELAPVTAGQSRRVLQGQRPAPRLGRITRRIFTGRPYLGCQRLPPSRLRECTARMGVSKMPPMLGSGGGWPYQAHLFLPPARVVRVSPCGIGFWARARSSAILQRILSHLGLPGTREGPPPPCSMTEIGGEHPALPGVTVYAMPWAQPAADVCPATFRRPRGELPPPCLGAPVCPARRPQAGSARDERGAFMAAVPRQEPVLAVGRRHQLERVEHMLAGRRS